MRGALFDVFAAMSGQSSWVTAVVSLFSILVVIFLCLPFHEFAHAFAAKCLGDDTAEESGRLTLNPFAHIDPIGALCMALCSIGWAKPTPVNLGRCRKVSSRAANLIVSLAGPVSNILLSFVIVVICKIIMRVLGGSITQTAVYIIYALVYAANINVFLAVFNLLPIPPFDGYAILASVLPRKAAIFLESKSGIINLIVFILIFSGARILSAPLGIFSDLIMKFLNLITKFIYPVIPFIT